MVAGLGVSLSSLKKVLIISSVFSLSRLTFLLTPRGWAWKIALGLYGFSLTPLIVGRERFRRQGRETSQSEGLGRAAWLLIFLRLRGVPPLPGFYFKLEVLRELLFLKGVGVRMLRFIFGRLVFIYIYLGVMFKPLLKARRHPDKGGRAINK